MLTGKMVLKFRDPTETKDENSHTLKSQKPGKWKQTNMYAHSPHQASLSLGLLNNYFLCNAWRGSSGIRPHQFLHPVLPQSEDQLNDSAPFYKSATLQEVMRSSRITEAVRLLSHSSWVRKTTDNCQKPVT